MGLMSFTKWTQEPRLMQCLSQYRRCSNRNQNSNQEKQNLLHALEAKFWSCESKINHWGKNINLVFIVSSSKCTQILGLDSSVKLKLIQRVKNIMQNDSPNFFAKFKNCLIDIAPCQKSTIYQ